MGLRMLGRVTRPNRRPMNSDPIARGRFNTNRAHRIRYTLWAPVYDGLARIFRSRRRRAVELARLRPGERVLVLGAGTGLDLEFLRADVAITAIDLTPAMLDRLRRRADRLGLAVDARIMDGQALAFPDATFDAVLLHLILAVIPDPVRCLEEVERVLKPGGRAVVFDKFIPDDGRPNLAMRLVRPILSFLATEITRRLGPLLAAARLEVVSDETAGFKGLYRIVVARKRDEFDPKGHA
jgi:ubiquinone/menaquinone biosynthesis C-methylase UbiE